MPRSRRPGTVSIGASDAAPARSPDARADRRDRGRGDGYVDLPVRLSAPGQNTVTVDYTTLDGTAVARNACNSTTSRIGHAHFAPGETTKVVRVEIFDCPERL